MIRPLTRPVPRVGYRLLTILAGTLLAVWAGTSPVLAHSVLISTNPADQEMVQSPPQAVVLTFDDSVIATGTQVVVTGPSGFTAKPAATQLPTSPQTSPTTAPNQTQPTRMPGWLKLAIGVVAIIFAVTVARRASRRGNDSRP